MLVKPNVTRIVTSEYGFKLRYTSPDRMRACGGTQAWIQAGLPLETGTTRMADQADDVFLSPRERRQNREDAMREYLTW